MLSAALFKKIFNGGSSFWCRVNWSKIAFKCPDVSNPFKAVTWLQIVLPFAKQKNILLCSIYETKEKKSVITQSDILMHVINESACVILQCKVQNC